MSVILAALDIITPQRKIHKIICNDWTVDFCEFVENLKYTQRYIKYEKKEIGRGILKKVEEIADFVS